MAAIGGCSVVEMSVSGFHFLWPDQWPQPTNVTRGRPKEATPEDVCSGVRSVKFLWPAIFCSVHFKKFIQNLNSIVWQIEMPIASIRLC